MGRRRSRLAPSEHQPGGLYRTPDLGGVPNLGQIPPSSPIRPRSGTRRGLLLTGGSRPGHDERPPGPPLVSPPQPPNPHGSAPRTPRAHRGSGPHRFVVCVGDGGALLATATRTTTHWFRSQARDRCAGRVRPPPGCGWDGRHRRRVGRAANPRRPQMARAAVDCEAGETNGSLCVLLQQEGPPVADADDRFVRSAALNGADPDRAEPCESGGCGGDPLGGPGGRGRVAPSGLWVCHGALSRPTRPGTSPP